MSKLSEKISNWFSPTEKNVSKNKGLIMSLLFQSEYQELTTQESIQLFEVVKKEFESELGRRVINAEIEREDINQYFKKK